MLSFDNYTTVLDRSVTLAPVAVAQILSSLSFKVSNSDLLFKPSNT